jgi:DNA polymerase-3 subunit delta
MRSVKKAVLTRAADFNFTELDAKEAADKIVPAADMLPMMAERRLVLVRKADEIKADAADRLLGYVENPAKTTVLLLVGATLDARTRLAKALQKAGAVFNCSQLKRSELQHFVTRKMADEGTSVAPEVYDILFDAFGQDLAQWLLALERMQLYLGGKGRIEANVAEELVFRTRAESIFALTDALLAGQTGKVLALAEELYAQKEAPLAMVGLCARQIRQLLILREAMDRGEQARDHLRTAGVPPFAADKYLASAKKASLEQLRHAHRKLAEADYRLKSSPLGDAVTWFSALWDVMAATA